MDCFALIAFCIYIVLLRLSVYVLTTAESRVKVCPVKLGQWEFV